MSDQTLLRTGGAVPRASTWDCGPAWSGRRPVTPKIVGSNPISPAFPPLAQRLELLLYKRKVVGSSPTRRTIGFLAIMSTALSFPHQEMTNTHTTSQLDRLATVDHSVMFTSKEGSTPSVATYVSHTILQVL